MTDKGERAPRVSIGLAVFNGEKYLEAAIESILAQTFEDFELIISDNASTDRTGEICKKYAARDSRIRYSRNETNIGGANNENLTFRLSRGEYFRWAAHDDICAPRLLERCVEVLDSHPEVVLCHSAVVEIDENGTPQRTQMRSEGSAGSPFHRFRRLTTRVHKCEATYGLMRSAVLRKTRLQLNYTDSDRVLLCELALHGPFYQIAEPLFFKRFHSGNRYKDWRGRMAWFLPELQNTGKITFPNWLQLFDYFATVGRVSMPWSQKALCYTWMGGPWMVVNGQRLVKDLLVGAYMFAQPRERRQDKYKKVDQWI